MKTNTDGNLDALRRYEDEQDAIDSFREMHEQEANDYALDKIIESDSDLSEYLTDMPKPVFDAIALGIGKEYDCKDVDYCEIGRLLIKHLTDDIVASNHFDDLSEQYIESKQGV